MYTHYTYTHPNIVAWKLQKFNVLRVRIRLTIIIMSNYIWNQIYFHWNEFEECLNHFTENKNQNEWKSHEMDQSSGCLGILNVRSDVNVCRIFYFLVGLILTCSLDEVKIYCTALSHSHSCKLNAVGHIYFYMLINCRNKTKNYGINKDGKQKNVTMQWTGSYRRDFARHNYW